MTNSREAMRVARTLADTWLQSNYNAYNQSQKMYEKVSALVVYYMLF